MGKRKTIVCLETGKQFNSVENAANAIGVSSGFISRQIKAGKPIKGFYYYYAGEMLPDEYRQKIRNQKKKPNKNSRPVICLETGERFESISLVSRMLMKFLNTYGIKVFDVREAQRVLAREVETFMEVAEALAALRREADRNNIQIRIDDFDNPDAEQEG